MLFRELISDALVLARILPEWGYWHARAEWRMSDADIHGHLAFAGVAAFAALSFPVSREQSSIATAIVFPIIDRAVVWVFNQRWFHLVKKGLLVTTSIGSIILLLLTPHTNSQEMDPFSIPNIVRRHDNDIAVLRESMKEMALTVKQMKEEQSSFFDWLKGIGVVALTTIVGLNVTNYYNDAKRGRMEREREERGRGQQRWMFNPRSVKGRKEVDDDPDEPDDPIAS